MRSTRYRRDNVHNDRGLFLLLLAIVAWAPLPHGGERFQEIGPIAAATFLLLAIWSFCQWRSRAALPPQIRELRLPLLLMGAWLAYTLLQTIPLSESLLATLSPTSAALKAQTRFSIGTPASTLSIDPGATLMAFIKYASLVALFFLALVLATTEKRLRILTATILLTGAALCLYSLINHVSNGALNLNAPISPWGNSWHDSVHGTYSNRNNFAGLLEVILPLGIGWLLWNPQGMRPAHPENNKALAFFNFAFSEKGLLLFALSIMLINLYLTKSRGGNLAFFSALLITTFLLFAGRRKGMLLKWSALLFAIALGVLLFASGGVVTRLENNGLEPNGRHLLAKTALNTSRHFMLFGSGAGTYPYIQYRYKDPLLGTTAMSKRAHNEYLETLADQGIIGFSLLGSAVALMAWRLLLALRSTRSIGRKGLLIGAFAGITSLLLHSTVEFNFHIPANAIYFWMAMAIGLNSVRLGRRIVTPVSEAEELTTVDQVFLHLESSEESPKPKITNSVLPKDQP